MVPPRTLRRKLQKKAKRKGWFRCPQCGIGPHRYHSNGNALLTSPCRCGWRGILYWPGLAHPRHWIYPGKHH